MYEFEYTNGLLEQEVDLIIKFISKELSSIRRNRKNLVAFAYSESIKGNLIFIDFKRIINETQRMSVEIEFLEKKRNIYIETKEKQQRQWQH
jgi:hypothetical protein